jgi:CHAT domain-containing protein
MIFPSKFWQCCIIFISFSLALFALFPSEARSQATPEQKQAILKLLDDAGKSKDQAIATEMVQKAVKMAFDLNDKHLLAFIQNQWGSFLISQNRAREARPYAETALTLSQELKSDAYCGWAEGLLFDIYRLQGDNKEALNHGRACLEYEVKIKADHQIIQGLLDQLERTEHLVRPLPTPADRERYEYYHDLAERAGLKVNAAIMQTDEADCIEMSDPREALRLYENALLILKSDSAVYSQMVAAKTMTAIGTTYLSWGLWEEALSWFDKAEPMVCERAKAGDNNAEVVLLKSLTGAGIAYSLTQRPDQARPELEKAIYWNNKVGKPLDVSLLESLLSIARQSDQDKRPDVSVLIRDARRKLVQPSLTNTTLIQASSQLMFAGWTLYYQDQFPQALAALKQAKKTFERVSDDFSTTSYQIALLVGLGVTETELKHEAEAEKYLKEAVKQEGILFHSIPSPQQRAQQYPLNVIAYRAFARLRLRQGRTPEALMLLERGRAQSISAQYIRLAALHGLDASDRADFFKVSQALLAKKTPTAEAILAYNQEEEKLHRSRKLPEFSPLVLERGDIDLLKQRHPDTLFVEWSSLDDHTVLLIAFGSKDRIWSSEWKVPRNSLQTNRANPVKTEIAARWLMALQKGYDTEQELAAQLYKLLFAPLETKTEMLEPGRYRRLALVTDGEMANLPFAALQDTKGSRLLDRYTISVQFSLKMLAKPLTFPDPDVSTLVVADPRPDTEPLLVAHDSAQRVAGMFPHATFLVGKDATQTETLAAMQQPMLLVFATHGERMSLLLAADPKSKDNGKLEAWQVALTPLHARLAVLWGCETGLGKPVGAEGLLGFVWAFHAAGCPAVVCSQWAVNEQTASDLMIEFHTELKHGFAADEALTRAMKSMRQKKPLKPADWAPFQLYGSAPSLFAAPSHFDSAKTR